MLEQFRQELMSRGTFDSWLFEHELHELWNLGYRSLKDLIVDLASNNRFKHVAAYYMQFSNTSGPVCEFKPTLARLYGLRTYDCEECEQARDQYWANFRSNADPVRVVL